MRSLALYIQLVLVLSWLGGCVSGFYLEKNNLVNGGAASFGVLLLFALVSNKEVE